MAKRDSVVMRSDLEWKKVIDSTRLAKMKNGTWNPLKRLSERRTTLAYANVLKKYPHIKKEVEVSEFK